MSAASTAKAWEAFWASSAAQGGSGCLPHARPRIEPVQAAVWREAVRLLPKRAGVLDLATGDGAVLKSIRKSRPDLKLVGVDSSKALPKSPSGLTLHAGVRMESLPFRASSFHLVTSQYGFEYGDAARVARETARVLRPGSRFVFIVHHADGPIVNHSLARREALKWAAFASGSLDRARALAAARRLVPVPISPLLFQTIQEARALFPTQPVAEEFVTAVVRVLEWGRHSSADEQLRSLTELEELASNELMRIEALAAAAANEKRLLALVSQLEGAALVCEPPLELREEGQGCAFAWKLPGARP